MKNKAVKKIIKRNISDWILDFERKFLEISQIKNENKEIIVNIYKKSSKARNNFYNNYLPVIYHNLNCQSSRDFYNYKYFFSINNYNLFELSNKYSYNKDKHLLKTNYSTTNLGQKKLKQQNSNLKFYKCLSDKKEENKYERNEKEINYNYYLYKPDKIIEDNIIQNINSEFNNSNENEGEKEIEIIKYKKNVEKDFDINYKNVFIKNVRNIGIKVNNEIKSNYYNTNEKINNDSTSNNINKNYDWIINLENSDIHNSLNENKKIEIEKNMNIQLESNINKNDKNNDKYDENIEKKNENEEMKDDIKFNNEIGEKNILNINGKYDVYEELDEKIKENNIQIKRGEVSNHEFKEDYMDKELQYNLDENKIIKKNKIDGDVEDLYDKIDGNNTSGIYENESNREILEKIKGENNYNKKFEEKNDINKMNEEENKEKKIKEDSNLKLNYDCNFDNKKFIKNNVNMNNLNEENIYIINNLKNENIINNIKEDENRDKHKNNIFKQSDNLNEENLEKLKMNNIDEKNNINQSRKKLILFNNLNVLKIKKNNKSNKNEINIEKKEEENKDKNDEKDKETINEEIGNNSQNIDEEKKLEENNSNEKNIENIENSNVNEQSIGIEITQNIENENLNKTENNIKQETKINNKDIFDNQGELNEKKENENLQKENIIILESEINEGKNTDILNNENLKEKENIENGRNNKENNNIEEKEEEITKSYQKNKNKKRVSFNFDRIEIYEDKYYNSNKKEKENLNKSEEEKKKKKAIVQLDKD